MRQMKAYRHLLRIHIMPSVEDRFAISELLTRMAYYYDEGLLDHLEASF